MIHQPSANLKNTLIFKNVRLSSILWGHLNTNPLDTLISLIFQDIV